MSERPMIILYTTPTSAATNTIVGSDLPHLQIDRSIQIGSRDQHVVVLLGAKNLIVDSRARESFRGMAHDRLQNDNNKDSCQCLAGTAPSV